MTTQRRIIIIASALIVTLIAGIVGYNVVKSHDTACPPVPTTYPTHVPAATVSPVAQPAVQLWGAAAFSTHMSTILPNGHYFAVDDGYADGSVLIGSEQTCNSSIVSTYTVTTGTIHHLYTLVDGGGERTDGRYVAWVAGKGFTGAGDIPRQVVGYADIQTGKVTILLDHDSPTVQDQFAVTNGMFIWGDGKFHITTLATNITKTLPISGYFVQVDWPYLLYSDYLDKSNKFNTVYHLYNLETNQNNTILATMKPYLPLYLQGTTVYWLDDMHQIQQMDHADQPTPQSHVVYTLPEAPTIHPKVTDRLFIWVEDRHVYAWDRLLHQKVLLPIAAAPYSSEPPPPAILSKLLVLYNQGDYTIIDTTKLPTTVTP